VSHCSGSTWFCWTSETTSLVCIDHKLIDQIFNEPDQNYWFITNTKSGRVQSDFMDPGCSSFLLIWLLDRSRTRTRSDCETTSCSRTSASHSKNFWEIVFILFSPMSVCDSEPGSDPNPGPGSECLKVPQKCEDPNMSTHTHTHGARGLKGYWMLGWSSQPIRCENWELGFSSLLLSRESADLHSSSSHTHMCSVWGSKARRQQLFDVLVFVSLWGSQLKRIRAKQWNPETSDCLITIPGSDLTAVLIRSF